MCCDNVHVVIECLKIHCEDNINAKLVTHIYVESFTVQFSYRFIVHFFSLIP